MDPVRVLHPGTLVLQSPPFQSRAGGGAQTQDPLRSRPTSLAESPVGASAGSAAPPTSQLELPTARRQPGRVGGARSSARAHAFLSVGPALHEKSRAVQTAPSRAGP